MLNLNLAHRIQSISVFIGLTLFLNVTIGAVAPAVASDNAPWKDKSRAIVLDAYERNPLDWLEVVKNKQIRAFIGKASDGLPSPYNCSGDDAARTLCKKTFQNYFMKQRLYHTRRLLAKKLGLKWGAYHLGRPGNPVAQADHFLNFAKPEPDELIAIDIEHDDPTKWISFADAEIFAKRIHEKIGRYPVLYTNHHTAQRIAARRNEFPVLSRLPLWYARYRPEIEDVFPMGNWENYDLWQFSSGINCNEKKCLYRVAGAPDNIDVNVSTKTIPEFDKAWPFDQLVPARDGKRNSDPLYLSEVSSGSETEGTVPDPIEDSNSVETSEFAGLNAEELEKLGVSAIAIPIRSPRVIERSFDVANLVVKIKKRSDVAEARKRAVAALEEAKDTVID